jgi:hypothetical protein
MKIEVENAQQNEQVDWSKTQLVTDGEQIVLVDIDQRNVVVKDCFVGTLLNKLNCYTSNGWIKKAFKPFHGKITLSND